MAQKTEIVNQVIRMLHGLDLNKVQDMELKVENITREHKFRSPELTEPDIAGVEVNLKVYYKREEK